MKKRDTPLQAQIEGDEFVIRVGVDVLVHATVTHEEFYDDQNEQHAKRGPPYITVADKTELLQDIRRMILKEGETGRSPLSDLFDQAIMDAWEDGSLAFSEESYEAKP